MPLDPYLAWRETFVARPNKDQVFAAAIAYFRTLRINYPPNWPTSPDPTRTHPMIAKEDPPFGKLLGTSSIQDNPDKGLRLLQSPRK